MTRYVLIGAIARPHGIKGDVQIVPFHVDSPLWCVGTELALLPRRCAERTDDTVKLDRVETVRLKRLNPGAKGRLIAWIDGIANRAEAERHKGAWLAVAEDALGELGEGEFWHHEITGWQVVSDDEEALGTAIRIVSGPSDLLEIRPVRGGETYFVPMRAEFVLEVDRQRARIVIAPIEGLIP
jgi:16S rRNA processing protein RimM